MHDQSIDESRHFNLRRVSTIRQANPVPGRHLDRRSLSFAMIDNLVALAADEQRRRLNLFHALTNKVVVRSFDGADQAELPPAALEATPVIVQQSAIGFPRFVEDGANNRSVVAALHAIEN